MKEGDSLLRYGAEVPSAAMSDSSLVLAQKGQEWTSCLFNHFTRDGKNRKWLISLDMEETSKKLKKRQKLCHNCEGEIDLDVIVCPFCAADLREEKPEQGRSSFNAGQKVVQDQQTSQSLYPSSFPIKPPEAAPEPQRQQPEAVQEGAPSTNSFGPTILFTLGVQLVLLGLLMLLFSHKGMVVLRWNASWWFMYCLAGFPFLYIGYRALSKL